MNDRRQQSIREYLQQRDAQVRILNAIQQARAGMTVTISRAASLFHFSESQLREWEKRGLLQTERPLLSSDGKGSTGHRQYSLQMVSKLAIIKDLLDQGFAPGDIPANIDTLWEEVAGSPGGPPGLLAPSVAESERTMQMPIDERVEQMDAQEFWRYFVAQALRLSLLLICEEMPDTVAGLVLPLEERNLASVLTSLGDLKEVGRSLVGWLGRNRSFYLFLTDAPSFHFPTDFRLQTLQLAGAQTPTGDKVLDKTLIVLERSTRRSSLTPELQEMVRRLLALVYLRVDRWEAALAHGTRDWLYQTHDLELASQVDGERIFNALLERVIELGGQTSEGRDRWRFCTLLLPDDPHLPVQQQSLIVRAQTRNSPFQIGLTRISPQDTAQGNSITLKAFEGSQAVCLQAALPGDSMLAPQHVRVITSTPEMIARGQPGGLFQPPPAGETIHSALAMPVVGEHGIPIAVFYIEADQADAFSLDDQRVLRLLSRMLEELLMTARARSQRMARREMLLEHPAIVDGTFGDFAVEADFIAEIDSLLSRIQQKEVVVAEGRGEISILSVDIDNQSSVAMKYGHRVARNLSHQLGLRLRGNINSSGNFKLFHVSADKYYLLLEGVGLEDARSLAQQLQAVLSVGEYRIPPLSASSSRAVLHGNTLDLTGVTVHMGVSTYTIGKLEELLQRYPPHTAVLYVRTLLLASIDMKLERGKLEGGNCIISWDTSTWGHRVL